MEYRISNINLSEDRNIALVLARIPLSLEEYIEIEVMNIGAGIRKICYVNSALGIERLLTLSYDDIAESCHNSSLAGLTICPNAGRLKANEDITLSDGTDSLTVKLTANEDGYKQIHGGEHNLAKELWDFVGVNEFNEGIEICFSNSQPDVLDGWAGNRSYQVSYRIYDNGRFETNLSASTDKLTYINMTNHTYWLRAGVDIEINADKMVLNNQDFLPAGLGDVSSVHITSDAILNNAFLIRKNPAASLTNAFLINESPTAKLTYSDIPLKITLSTDAPAVVVYTGDYLDNTSVLCNKKTCAPGCAVALEAQELYPFTNTKLANAKDGFSRNIVFDFKAITLK